MEEMDKPVEHRTIKQQRIDIVTTINTITDIVADMANNSNISLVDIVGGFQTYRILLSREDVTVDQLDIAEKDLGRQLCMWCHSYGYYLLHKTEEQFYLYRDKLKPDDVAYIRNQLSPMVSGVLNVTCHADIVLLKKTLQHKIVTCKLLAVTQEGTELKRKSKLVSIGYTTGLQILILLLILYIFIK